MSHGIHPQRIKATGLSSWERHTAVKGAADLVLDTVVKNGHTSTADVLWGGAPVITVSGNSLSQRWAGSLLSALGMSELVMTSMKEYEDVAVLLADSPVLLDSLRRKLRSIRWTSNLFNTISWVQNFESLLLQIYELHHAGKGCMGMHVINL